MGRVPIPGRSYEQGQEHDVTTGIASENGNRPMWRSKKPRVIALRHIVGGKKDLVQDTCEGLFTSDVRPDSLYETLLSLFTMNKMGLDWPA